MTTIGNGVFYGCAGLTEVTIPEGVTTIRDHAFRGCTELTKVTIPGNVTFIGRNAFDGCTALETITIPNSVTSVGEGAFSGCTGLIKAVIPDHIHEKKTDFFKSCPQLEVLPGSTPPVSDNSQKIVVDLGFCNLIAEPSVHDGFKEVGVYIEEKKTGLVQDLVLVGNNYKINENLDVVQTDGSVVIRVWTDEGNEDYTHKFSVNMFSDDEAN